VSTDPAVRAAVAELWQQFRPLVAERLAVLDACVAAAAGGRLGPQQREDGIAAAHKLAGTLDSYGRTGGSATAAEVEDLLRHDSPPADRLRALVDRLHLLVEDP
jgi:hypothetical protein